MTAVKAIHAATNLALGFTLNINIPLMIIPTPITRIPPTPRKKWFQNEDVIESKTYLKSYLLMV